MIPTVLLFTLVLLALLEAASRREDLRHLSVLFSMDTTLAEPGETVTLRYTVRNTGILPILYAGITLRLDSAFTPEEDEAFLRTHVSSDYAGLRVQHHFFLAPKKQFSGKLRLSVQQRGLHDLGKYYLEFGDFFGLKPQVRSGSMSLRLICTAAPCETPALRILGGELGNTSVRRFLHDDPTMVLGYRDYSGREPMKQISWNQSARAGRLIVRQNDFTTDRTAVILVNVDPTSRRLMERCLSLTGSVCRLLEREKIPYSMLSNGDLFSLTEGLGAGHLFFIQRRIGLSRLTGYTRFSVAMESCLCRRQSGRTHIVITPLLDEDTQAAVRRLARYTDRPPVVLCAEEDVDPKN